MNKFNLKDKVAIKSQQTTAIIQSINFTGTDKGVFYELCSENGHHFYDAYEDDLELVKKYQPHSPWTDDKRATLKRIMDKNNKVDDEFLDKCQKSYELLHQDNNDNLIKSDKQLLIELFTKHGYKFKEGKFHDWSDCSIVVDNNYDQRLHFDFEVNGDLEDMGMLNNNKTGLTQEKKKLLKSLIGSASNEKINMITE